MSYLSSLFSLTGKLALITGGSSGIGRSITTALGRSGCTVIILARQPVPIQETLSHLSNYNIDASAIQADLSNRDSLHAAIAKIKDDYGIPDILVNAAGVNDRPHMNDLTLETWDKTLAINLTAPFILGQSFGPSMSQRGTGRIINILSQQSFRAFGNSGVYGVSKGGLLSLTRSQAEAWSPQGVTCNAIVPGMVETPMTKGVFEDEQLAKRHAERTMTKRNGRVDDFEGAVVYLASDASRGVTGQTIFVDGGYSVT